MKTLFLPLFSFFIGFAAFGRANENDKNKQHTQQNLNQGVLLFFENKGQIRDQYRRERKDIDFKLPAESGLNVFVGSGNIAYQFNALETKSGTKKTVLQNPEKSEKSESVVDFYRMDLKLLGSNPKASIITGKNEQYFEQYFTDWSGGKSVRVNTYTSITYQNIYPQIDWVLYVKDGHLKHEFILKAGANYTDIQISYEGAESLRIDDKGDFEASTSYGTITEQAPVCFDTKGNIIASRYHLNNTTLSYEIENFSGNLTIDPTLYWSTYYGHSNDEYGESVSTDVAGNAYMGGTTNSVSNIATTGAHQTTIASSANDGFIAKFDRFGNRIWGTYYGGAGMEKVWDICNDPSGNVILTGTTSSNGGIASTGAHKIIQKGGDGFIAKFNSAGTLLWGTYVGGDSSEGLYSIISDFSGNIYACGLSRSSTGVATAGAYQTVWAGDYDGIIYKFNNSGILQWATYYGGSSFDHPYAIDIDAAANVYVSGGTYSSTGIATPGAYKTSISGGTYVDAFLAKFNSSGAMQWASYFGGTMPDEAKGVATDAGSNVYICGITTSYSDLATPGAHQTVYGGTEDAFLAKFNSSGMLQWSTYYGGEMQETAFDVDIDDSGDPIMVGSANSKGFTGTLNAYKRTIDGYQDAFITKFTTDGKLDWSTYFGGPVGEDAQGIKINGINNVYVTGTTNSTSGIATSGAHQSIHGGVSDAYLAKFNFCVTYKKPADISGPSSVCLGKTISMSNSVPGGVWSSTMPSVTSVDPLTGVVTPIKTGIDTVLYTITDSCGKAVAAKIINVFSLVPPQICVASLDTMINKNQIVWEKLKYRNVDQFNIYKKDGSGTFIKIGSQPFSATSIFKDLSSSPATESNSYKITITDSCGSESLLSAGTVHTTVFLSSSIGSGAWVNLNWNLYAGKTISKQFVLRSSGTGPFTSISSLSATDIAFTDLAPPSGTVKYRILTLSSKCSPTGTFSGYDSILSNISNPNAANIVEQQQLYNVTFYPNPAQSRIQINGLPESCQIQLFNTLGQLILNEKNQTSSHQITVSHIPKGLYFLKIIGNEGSIKNQKLVKE